MKESLPKKVYRYQALTSRTISLLCRDSLYFADPEVFNDPFDCKPTIVSDTDKITLRKILFELIKRKVISKTLATLRNAQIQGNIARTHANKSGEQAAQRRIVEIEYYSTDPEFSVSKEEAECRLLTSAIEREIIKRYDRGVCCFSAVFDSPLLWSHYAEQHKGICIGYSLNRTPKPKIQKIEYGGPRELKTSLIAQALLGRDQIALNLIDQYALLRKAPSWRYEREWRLIGNKGIQDSPLMLTDVIFGLRCSSELKYALISALEPRDTALKFFEMYEIKGSFRLKRKLIDIEELRICFPAIARSGEEIFYSTDLE